MLFDFGWSEILLIGTVALVFIGPKDLPKAMRVAGYWVRKARTLSREFQSSIDQMIREAELDEMRQDLKKAAEFDINKEFHNTIDPTGSLSESLKPPELPNFSAAEPAPAPAPAMASTRRRTRQPGLRRRPPWRRPSRCRWSPGRTPSPTKWPRPRPSPRRRQRRRPKPRADGFVPPKP